MISTKEHPSVVSRSNRLLKEALIAIAVEIETYQKPAVCISIDPSMTRSMDVANKARASEREYWVAVIRAKINNL